MTRNVAGRVLRRVLLHVPRRTRPVLQPEADDELEFADFALATDGPQGTGGGGTTGGGGGPLGVTISKTKDWGNGYTDTGTVTNTTGSAVTGWNVQFDLRRARTSRAPAA